MVDSVGTLFAEAEEKGVVELTRNLGKLADNADRAEASLDRFNDQTARGQRVNSGSGGGGGGAGGGGAGPGGLYAAIAAQSLLASKNVGDLSTATRQLARDHYPVLEGASDRISRANRRELEIRNALSGATAVGRDMAVELADANDKTTTSFMGLGRAALVAGGSLTVGAVALGAVALSASRASLSLGRAVAETSTLLEGTSRQIRELTERSGELAATFGGTAAAQALGYYAIYSAGAQNAAEALDTLVAANRFAIGGVTDLASATQLLTGTLNAYSAFGLDAVEVSDIFFEVIRNGITTAERLAASFANVSSIAAGFGVNLQTTGSAVAALTATGTQTSEATTQIRALIAALQNLNDQQRLAIRGLGVTSTAPADFVQIIRELETGLSTFGTATERSTALGEVFGSQIEALAAALSLTGGGFETFQRTLDATNNSLGATSRAFNKIATSDAQMLEEATGRIEEANVKLGASVNRLLIPAYGEYADIISTAATNLNNLITIARENGFLAAIFSGGSTQDTANQADTIREARLVTESNEQVAISNNLLASSYGSLAEAQVNAIASPFLADQQTLLSVNNVLIDRIMERNQLINDLAYAELLAGNISQRQYDARVLGEEDLTKAIETRDRVQRRINLANSRNLSRFLDGQAGSVSTGASADVATFNGARTQTNTSEDRLFAERRAFYEEEERLLQLQLETNNELIAGSTGDLLALYVSQGAQIRLQIRNNTISYDAVWDSYYGLLRERAQESADDRLAILEAETDAFVAGVVSRAERIFNENKRADKRATDEAVREAERRRRLLARLNPPSNPALAIDDLTLSNSESNAFVNDGFQNRLDASDAVNDFIDITGTAGTALENLAMVSDQSADSVSSALGSIGSIVGAFNPIAGLFINTIGGIISALDAVVGQENDTGFRANAGTGGISATQVDQRRTGLRRLFLGRNTSRDTTAAEQRELQLALQPNIALAAMIGELFDTAFTNVSAYGETVQETADSFLNLTAMQIGGIDALQMAGESLGQTLVRVAADADEANQAFISAGFLAGINPNSVAGQLAGQVGGFAVGNTLNLRSDEEQQGISLDNFTRILQGVTDSRGDREFTDAQITTFSTDSMALLDAIDSARNTFDSEAQSLQQILDLNAAGRAANGQTANASEILGDRLTVQTGLREAENLNALLRAAGLFDDIAVDEVNEPTERAERPRREADIRLGNEGFRTEAERRIAETTLQNTIGFELDERRNELLEIVVAELRSNNGNANETLRQQRIIDFKSTLPTNSTIANARNT